MRAALVIALLLLASLGTATANHPQSAGSRTTSFDHKTGNEWWVEVIVTGSPSSVQARDDGSEWKTLTLKSWGAWAASFHIQPGHRVQFRASWSNGDAATSCWFTHPAGVEQCEDTPPPPPPGPFVFDHAGGNEWWIEAEVTPMPGKVEAMDTGGAWTPLSFRSWGEWANSFHIEPGHEVRFRALASDGVWHESCWFSHPAGVERPCAAPPPAWPVEGSFVTYFAHEGESFDDAFQSETELNVTYTFNGGQWTRRCEGWTREAFNLGSENERRNETRHDETTLAAPPIRTDDPRPGESAGVNGVGCVGGVSGTVFGPVRRSVDVGALERSVVTKYVEYLPVFPAAASGHWDVATGLTVSWGFTGSHSHRGGRLVDTDAPLAFAAPARSSWPFEGSFARYELTQTGGGSATVEYRFEDGGWEMLCTVRHADGSLSHTGSGPEAPVHGPLDNVGAGQAWELPVPDSWCHSQWNDVIVERSQTITTTRNGDPYSARVWYADDFDDGFEDLDIWWDRNTGLYLEFDHDEVQGRLVDTDAPLRAG